MILKKRAHKLEKKKKRDTGRVLKLCDFLCVPFLLQNLQNCIASGKNVEILQKACGNFKDILRQNSANDPFPNGPIREHVARGQL